MRVLSSKELADDGVGLGERLEIESHFFVLCLDRVLAVSPLSVLSSKERRAGDGKSIGLLDFGSSGLKVLVYDGAGEEQREEDGLVLGESKRRFVSAFSSPDVCSFVFPWSFRTFPSAPMTSTSIVFLLFAAFAALRFFRLSSSLFKHGDM